MGPSMSLKTLLLCSDAKIVRVLRRVLGDLDIAVDLCRDADAALRKLTRQRFEAIIVTQKVISFRKSGGEPNFRPKEPSNHRNRSG